jgi:branched-chain amino acid transport system substrate-binding protein
VRGVLWRAEGRPKVSAFLGGGSNFGRKHLLLGAVFALVAAACNPPTAQDEAAEEGEQGGPIVVGSAMPLTGPFASDGEEMLEGIEMAVDEYNAEGGLLGRTIELVTCDVAALEVDTIQACAQRLLGENPDAIITGYDDSGVNTLAFGDGDMPYLHAVTMTASVDPVREDPEKYGNTFQYDPSDYDYGVNAAEMLPQVAEQIGFQPANQSIAVITTDYSYNTVGADSFIEHMEPQGYEVAFRELTGFGVEEWGPVLSKIERAEPAFVGFFNLDPADASRFMNQFVDRFGGSGLQTLVYMQYTPSIPEFLELTGENANGLLWSTVLGVTDEVGRDNDDYTQRFEERFGHEPRSIHPYVVRDAFDIWATAVEEAGCAECFDQVIGNIRNIRFEGFGGVYTFAPLEEGQYGLPGENLIPTIWSQVQNGQHVQVLPEVVADGEIQMPPWVP